MNKPNQKPHKEMDDAMFEKLVSSSHAPKGRFSSEESYKKLQQQFPGKRNNRYLYASIAASILLIIGLSLKVYYNSLSPRIIEIETFAETKQVILPEGTKIILNNYSTLKYPAPFDKNKRDVILSGEAYFEVAKDKQKPFIVQTDLINIEVLGTHFNITSYKNDSNIETTLLEGSVAVSNKDNSQKIILKPNESAIYNKQKGLLTYEVIPNAMEDVAWINGTLLFKNSSLEEISRKLSNQFNIDIQIKDSILKKYKLTAKFDNNESIDEILRLLQRAGNFAYTKNETTITITNKN